MTKRQQQRIAFVNSIDTSEWRQYSQSDRYLDLRELFVKYHSMMMDHRMMNAEEFVKKYWLLFYKDRTDLLYLNETRINNQKSVYSIDYPSCAMRIIDQVVYQFSNELKYLEERVRCI